MGKRKLGVGMTVQFDKFDRGARPVRFIPNRHRPGLYRNFFKRVFDTLFILVTLPFTFLLIAILAAMVAVDGGKPLYRSPRVGRKGTVFGMLKLRTMIPDSDAVLKQHLAENSAARIEWERTQKLKDDPRVTKLGKVLRKTSLDELPQLWNVLVGDMSLVGPRPMLKEQEPLYPGIAYYSLRPGMTGSWQVNSRNESEFCRRSEYDQDYDKELSLKTDIKLLIRTVGVVLRGTGY